MVCVLGGKDSATLLYLLQELQDKLPISFQITAVHVDQKQPGYNGTVLVEWLKDLQVNYHVVEEDTYSIVVDKTAPNKSYCTVCSRFASWHSLHHCHFSGMQQDYAETSW